jgi:hypothetical protein
MGGKVLVANLDLLAPFTDAVELLVTAEDCGRIEMASGTGSHGEGVWRVRDPDGTVAEVWLGGGRLVSESKVVTEMSIDTVLIRRVDRDISADLPNERQA